MAHGWLHTAPNVDIPRILARLDTIVTLASAADHRTLGGRAMRAIHRLVGDQAWARAASVAGCSLIAAAVMLPASSVVLADTMGGAEVQSVGISEGGHLISINVDGNVLTVVGTGREELPPDVADVDARRDHARRQRQRGGARRLVRP